MTPLILWTLWLQSELPDIRTVKADLKTPAVTTGAPAAGKRVRQTIPDWEGSDVYHAVYLPTDWRAGRRYPVLVEYAGNGNYKNAYGDISEGTVEGSNLGYGLSGGRGFIWVSMPYVDKTARRNAITWWGDAEATVEYCIKAVRLICEQHGGDPTAVVLTGFSRGAIGVNYLGLRTDEIADVWLGFMPFSQYDGVRQWNSYSDSGRGPALERLKRIQGRHSFITQEQTVADIEQYLAQSGVKAPFTVRRLPFRNHNDAWTLRDIPLRREARAWLRRVVRERPATHSVSGRVTNARGRGARGVKVWSGATHFTVTDRRGRYRLGGLIDGERTVRAGGAERKVTLNGRDATGIDLQMK